MYRTTILVLFSFVVVRSHSQSDVDSILSAIDANSVSLAAKAQLAESERLGHHTGIFPYDPTLEVDYMFGRPAALGNQTDIVAYQPLDFPTTYIRRKRLALAKDSTVISSFSVYRQELLFRAQLLCIDGIYLNKRIAHQQWLVDRADTILLFLKRKASADEVTRVELEKARMDSLRESSKLSLLQADLTEVLNQLTVLNGGTLVQLNDTLYPVWSFPPEMDSLLVQSLSEDPSLLLQRQQVGVSQLQTDLARSMWFPKIQAGYHYQAILGQTFNGVHLGITIPIWENKNTIQQAQAREQFQELALQEDRMKREARIQRLFDRYLVLKASVDRYESILSSSHEAEGLKASLELGGITYLQYLLEVHYLSDTMEQYLALERELHMTIAQLLKHQL